MVTYWSLCMYLNVWVVNPQNYGPIIDLSIVDHMES